MITTRQILRLKEPVTITGPNYFGRPAKLTFEQSKQAGWFWKVAEHGSPRLINSSCLTLGQRRLALVDQASAKRLEVYEHLGSLRFRNVEGVILSCDQSYPPYFGRPEEIWQKLKGALLPVQEETRWYTVEKPVTFKYLSEDRSVTFLPQPKGLAPSLYVCTQIDYPNLGRYEFDFEVGKDDLTPVFQAHAQGWPRSLYYVSAALRRLPLFLTGFPSWQSFWLHHHRVNWPQKRSRAETLELFAYHRLGDILGAFSVLIPPQGQLAGVIHSIRGGHALDQGLIQKIDEQSALVPLSTCERKANVSAKQGSGQ